jgi:hypothetical protein
MLVTEPEAAAVYTARYLKEKLGSRFRMRVSPCDFNLWPTSDADLLAR